MLRQLQLLPAGCQPWNDNMLDGTESKFAYCSTFAVNIYERSPDSNEYKLTSINSAHEKTITSIAWNKKKTNLIATSGADLKIVVWDVAKQKVFAQLRDLKTDPCCIDWINTSDNQYLTYIGASGYLDEWCISNGKVNTLKNISCITGSKISIFRWHHTKPETVSFGYHDGSVLILRKVEGAFKKTKIKFSDEPLDDDKVVLLSWDPLSEDYILIANKLTGIKMVDSMNGEVITSFSLPSRAVTTVTFSWIHSAPGMFLSGDYESGVLRLWSVGQESPLESFNIKQMGFNGIHVIDCVHGNCKRNFDQNNPYGSSRRKRSQSQSVTHSVPPANVVCTFRDGGVGLYDLQRRRWIFIKEQGHIETIFDCKFKADDPKILATASFDGTVKFWSTSSLSPIKTSIGNEGVIYSISWAPQNLDCIACGTRRKGVFIWDFNKERVIKRFMEHGSSCVFCVDWNRADSHKIASGSEDHTCVVRRLDGQDMHRLIHPATVYGCHWNINNKRLLATGCDDGVVRVWSVELVAKCILELKGHSMKVFHVRWHPLISNILCSGSDDHSIRVWDTSGEASCIAILNGHTNKVRGLSWNSEIPYLLVSGSWDSTIRLWDVRESNQKCLDVIDIHGADVYGLDSHSASPFVLASSSRDSTVRLWSVAPYIKILFAKVIVGHQFSHVLDEAELVMKSDLGIKLSGRMSKQISDELSSRPDSTPVKLRWLSEFFVGNPALENLWDVAFCSQGAKETAVSPDYKNGIIHKDHLIKYTTAKAQEMELKASKSLTGNRQQDLMLEKAAALQLKAGNLRKHCEILKQLGKWETALSLAAGVSIKYWETLTREYAQILEDCGSSEYLPYSIAIGDCEKCIYDLLQIGEYEDALVVAQTASERQISVPINNSLSKSTSSKNIETIKSRPANRVVDVDSKIEKLRKQCIDLLSLSKFSDGDPFRAATYYLSINEVGTAIDMLLQGNELLMALCLGKVLKINDERIKNATMLFARKLEHEGNYYFAIELIQAFLQCNVTQENWTPVHSGCARFIGDDLQRVNLNEYAGLPSPMKYATDGETYLASGDLMSAMQCFLLSTQQEKALGIGLDLLKKEMKRSDWTVADERLSQLSVVFTISSVILTRSDMQYQKDQLLALSALIGCAKALSCGFLVMVTPLLEHAIAMTERVEISCASPDFPVSSQHLKIYLGSWKDYYKKNILWNTKAKTIEIADLDSVKLLQFANIESVTSDRVVVFGSALPSHSDTLISALTNQRINGPSFCLDDGITIISLDEAIMWARVNEFSPTGSGNRIVPF